MLMTQSLSYRVTMAVATLLLALTSLGSAVRMAPAEIARAEMNAFLAIGGTLGDLCDETPAHNHAEHCPFCNTVAKVGPEAPAGHIWVLSPDGAQRSPAALTYGDPRHHTQNPVRGPPAVI